MRVDFNDVKQKLIEIFRKNPIFRFVLASSFATPLLKLIGHRIFIVYIWR